MDDIKSTLNRLLQASSPENLESRGDMRHGFQIGGYNLLLQSGTYCELTTRQNICSLPDCPSWFAGFINHRGHAVPTYDLDCFFSNSDTRTPLNRDFWILLLDSHPGTAGFIIHSLPSVLSDLSPVEAVEADGLPPPLAPFISSVWRRNEQRWFEINHKALLGHLKAQFQPLKR